MEVREVLLGDESLSYFMKMMKQNEARIYLAGQLDCPVSDVQSVEFADAKEQDPAGYMRFEVGFWNPADCIKDFIEVHWSHMIDTAWMSGGDFFKMLCIDCATGLKIAKSIFNVAQPPPKEDLDDGHD